MNIRTIAPVVSVLLAAGMVTFGAERRSSAAGRAAMERDTGVTWASEFLGAAVVDRNGDHIGKIKDIVLKSNGDVAFAVVSHGGFIGLGENDTPVPLQAMQWDAKGDNLELDLSKATFGRAPVLSDEWKEGVGAGRIKDMDTFFRGASDRYKSMPAMSEESVGPQPPGKGETMRRGAASQESASDMGRSDVSARKSADSAEAERSDDARRSMSSDMEQGDDTRTRSARRGAARGVEKEDDMWARRVSHIIGTDAINRQGGDVGEIKDLAFEQDKAKIAYAVVRLDKIEGGDGKMAAVPWSAVRMQVRNKTALLEADNNNLLAVAYERGRMPDLASSTYRDRASKEFGKQPYWTTYGFSGEERPRKRHER